MDQTSTEKIHYFQRSFTNTSANSSLSPWKLPLSSLPAFSNVWFIYYCGPWGYNYSAGPGSCAYSMWCWCHALPLCPADTVAWRLSVSERRTRSTMPMTAELWPISTARNDWRRRMRSCQHSGPWFTRGKEGSELDHTTHCHHLTLSVSPCSYIYVWTLCVCQCLWRFTPYFAVCMRSVSVYMYILSSVCKGSTLYVVFKQCHYAAGTENPTFH